MKIMQYVRENRFRSKYKLTSNVKNHNRKDQEMPNILPPTCNNEIARKKKKKESGSLF